MIKNSGLDKILGRVEDLDSVNLGVLIQRLARERKLQESVFNTIKDGILVVDSDGTVQYANAAAFTLIGLKDSDVGMIRLWKLVPDLAQFLQKQPVSDSDKNAPVVSREVELSYPEPRIVRLYMVPIDAQVGHDDSGGYVIVLSDITEDKVSLEATLENERINSIVRLSAGVAHELGNPLNSLTIHLQLIARKLQKLGASGELDNVMQSLEVCQGEVTRLDGIVRHFLEAVRPRRPELNELDVIETVSEVLSVQEAELSDRGIEVDIETIDELPTIMGDRDQIKQVFFNLIKNAMEAMQVKGHLRIIARSDEECVSIQFIDNGSGISETDLSKIFQAYYTTKDTGHGLGMMIVERIIRDHGGFITIESKEGVGTVIGLRFPRTDRRVRLIE